MDDRLKLRNLTFELGYYINTLNNASIVNHTGKWLSFRRDLTRGSVFEFSHEIGHIYQFKRREKKIEDLKTFYKSRSKLKVFLDELEAWIIGYYLCRKLKINTNGFIKHSYKCLKSYIKGKC